MSTALTLDPLISEFETDEAAVEYERWFRAKVEKSMNNPAQRIPHDEVVERMRQICRETD